IAMILPFSATTVSASRIGFSSAPDSRRPMFRITSLLGPVAWGASWAMDGRPFVDRPFHDFGRGPGPQSSRIIRSYANDLHGSAAWQCCLIEPCVALSYRHAHCLDPRPQTFACADRRRLRTALARHHANEPARRQSVG